MYLKIFRQLILISLFFGPQSLLEVKASQSNLIVNAYSNNLLISGWNPIGDKNKKNNKANEKTINTLNDFKKMPILKRYFQKARGYAVFPNVGKGGIGIGGARGKGEVFENGNVIGSTTLTQLSIGFQLGGQAFSQIIFFKDKKSLDRFTQGNFEFGASASAALISEGANASVDYSDGVAVLTFSKGGLMYEASIGGQKFSYSGY